MKKTNKKLSLYDVMQKKVDDDNILIYCIDPASKRTFAVCCILDALNDRECGYDLVLNLLAHQIQAKESEDQPIAYISEYIDNHLDTFKAFTEKYEESDFLIFFDYLETFYDIISGRVSNEACFELYQMLNK